MNEVETSGMILSVMPMGEYDRRVEILTADFGRITAFARGARKPGSALVSATRAFAFGKFKLFQGKSSYTLSSAQISEYFDAITKDLDVTYYGFYFLELAQYFTRENVDALPVLKLLYTALLALIKPEIPNKLVRSIYEIKLLNLNGLIPSLERLSSGQGIYAFAQNLSDSCRKAYYHVESFPPEKQFSFLLKEPFLQEFVNLSSQLLRMNVDRRLKSAELIMD